MSEKQSQSDSDKRPDELVREVDPSPESLQMLAGLVAMTNAELKEIDDTVVDQGNQHIKAQKWDPEAILQEHANEAMKATGVAPMRKQKAHTSAMPPSPTDMAPLPIPTMPEPPQTPQPVQQSQGYAAPFVTDPQVLTRLDAIEDKLNSLIVTYEKIVGSLLKNNTKQITIRFDDSKHTQQK